MITLITKILVLVFAYGLGFLGIFGKTYENGTITKIGWSVIGLISLVFIVSLFQEVSTYSKEQNEKVDGDSIKISQLRKDDSINKDRLKQYEYSIGKLNEIIDNAEVQKSLIDTLKRETDDIADLQNRLQNRSRELTLYTKRLNESTSEINKKLADTSGFCYVQILFTSTNKAIVWLRKRGDYPLYDVRIHIGSSGTFSKVVDSLRLARKLSEKEFLSMTKEEEKLISQASFDFNIGTVSTKEYASMITLGEVDIQYPRDSVIRVTFVSTYKSWLQDVRVKIKDGHIFTDNVVMDTYANTKKDEYGNKVVSEARRHTLLKFRF